MNCPKCNSAINMQMSRCSRCGHPILVYKKTIRISNSLYNAGLEKARIRDLSGAKYYLCESLKYNKSNTNARNLLGLVYYEMGETVEGLTQWILSKNMQKDDNEADHYIKIIQSDPQALDLNNQTIKKYNSALLTAKQGSFDIAIVQLKKVVANKPNFVSARQLLALLYIKTGDNRSAMEQLRAARRIDINNTITIKYIKELCETDDTVSEDEPVTHTTAATIDNRRIFKGDTNVEVKPVGTYKKERPRAFPLINVLIGVVIGLFVGVILISPTLSGRFSKEEAVEVNDYGTKLAEKDSTIQSLENDKKELEEQVEQLKAELEDAKSDKTIPIAEVYAKILEAYKKYTDGEIAAAIAILVDLDTSGVENKTALEIVKTIQSQDVKVASAEAFEKGRVAYNSGRYEEAAVYLQEALDLNPDNYDAMYFYGRLYHRQGDKEKAVFYYRKILEEYPDSPRAREARSRLWELGVNFDNPE